MIPTESYNISSVNYAPCDKERTVGWRYRGLTACDIPAATVARFHAKYKADPLGCWLWTGAKIYDGYGIVNLGREDGRQRTIYAHRIAYVLAHGPIPAGKPVAVVMHSCDNPSCVNPAHLALGTQRENLMDASSKGRLANRRTRWKRRPSVAALTA